MIVDSVMSRELVTISPDTTVASAVIEMTRHQVHNIPVVDEAGAFIGLFSLRRLAHALLPIAVQIDEESFDIGFLSGNSDEFLERLQTVGHQPVSQLLEKKKKLRFCRPGTSIPRLLQLLSENPTSLPVVVVEGEKNRVVGMVSVWDILLKIASTFLADDRQGLSSEGAVTEPGAGGEKQQ